MVFAADNQIINGCYNNKMGKLKVVDSQSQCKKNKQAPIFCNKMGLPGNRESRELKEPRDRKAPGASALRSPSPGLPTLNLPPIRPHTRISAG